MCDSRLRYFRQRAATQFKGALKEAERRLQESRWKEALKRESDYVVNFLTSWEPTGQGLAIFSCRPENLLKRKRRAGFCPWRIACSLSTTAPVFYFRFFPTVVATNESTCASCARRGPPRRDLREAVPQASHSLQRIYLGDRNQDTSAASPDCRHYNS
jgi:hypothetical protein